MVAIFIYFIVFFIINICFFFWLHITLLNFKYYTYAVGLVFFLFSFILT